MAHGTSCDAKMAQRQAMLALLPTFFPKVWFPDAYERCSSCLLPLSASALIHDHAWSHNMCNADCSCERCWRQSQPPAHAMNISCATAVQAAACCLVLNDSCLICCNCHVRLRRTATIGSSWALSLLPKSRVCVFSDCVPYIHHVLEVWPRQLIVTNRPHQFHGENGSSKQS